MRSFREETLTFQGRSLVAIAEGDALSVHEFLDGTWAQLPSTDPLHLMLATELSLQEPFEA